MKKNDITTLVGEKILSYTLINDKYLHLDLFDGTKACIILDDDGSGDNDSYASFYNIDLDSILYEEILSAEEKDFDFCGGTLVLKTNTGFGLIQIEHSHNGYYGFSYELLF